MRVLLLLMVAATLGIGLLGPTVREPVAAVQESADEASDPLAQLCAALPEPPQDYCPAQHDGGRPGDASDDCDDPSPTFSALPLELEGWLVEPIDPEDNYGVALQPGTPFMATLTTAPVASDLGLPGHRLEVWAPEPTGTPKCSTLLGTARPGAPLVFNTTVVGMHTLRVTIDGNLTPYASAVEDENCHMMCLIQQITGYEIRLE